MRRRFTCNYKIDIHNNEIRYTSSNGNIVMPYSTTAFGVNIITNTYENGEGIIKFDGDVVSIGKYAFRGCTSLTSVTIPDSVTSIGYNAFFNCDSLTSVIIPDGVTSIGDDAFTYCERIASVTIPDSVTSIGNYAFSNCTSLTSITIPDSITKIGYAAFRYCSSLTSVYCKPTTPPTGSNEMFERNDSGRKIYVPQGSVDAYKAASYWSNYSNVIVGYDFDTQGGVVAL